jgi:hypothetical protein
VVKGSTIKRDTCEGKQDQAGLDFCRVEAWVIWAAGSKRNKLLEERLGAQIPIVLADACRAERSRALA